MIAQRDEDYTVIKPEKVTSISSDRTIDDLSNGTLIVRLSKREYNIESILAFQGEKQAQLEKERIAKANINLIKEFSEYYSFSNVVFAYDVKLYEFLQNPSDAIFLNDQLEIDTSIKIKNEPIFILASHRYNLFELYDKDFKPLGKPFPKYSTTRYSPTYEFLIARSIQWISQLFIKDLSAEKFNKKLFALAK